jgi:hypothetical protein
MAVYFFGRVLNGGTARGQVSLDEGAEARGARELLRAIEALHQRLRSCQLLGGPALHAALAALQDSHTHGR